VLNKVDLARDLEKKRDLLPGAVEISAREGTGIGELKARIREAVT